MSLLFKTVGLLLIFSASVLWGFMKSEALKGEKRHIYMVTRSVETLGEYIRLGKGEACLLVNECFSKDYVDTADGVVTVKDSFLKTETVKILKDFFKDFGMQDSAAEYKRVCLYSEMLKKQYAEAEGKCREMCRLYSTLGVLCGVFLVIFLL